MSKSSGSQWTSSRNPDPWQAQASCTDPSLPMQPPDQPPDQPSCPQPAPDPPARPSPRPHPPAWRRPSLWPGAASPAGPGVAGAAWPGSGDDRPARRRSQAGKFATRLEVRLPRTGPAPGAVSHRPSPPPCRSPRGEGFSCRLAQTEASPSRSSSLWRVPAPPGFFRRPSLLSLLSQRGFAFARTRERGARQQFLDARFHSQARWYQ